MSKRKKGKKNRGKQGKPQAAAPAVSPQPASSPASPAEQQAAPATAPEDTPLPEAALARRESPPADGEAREGEPDAAEQMRARGKIPELAAFLAWVLPGLGHVYAGYPKKGWISMALVTTLFVLGVALSHGDAVHLDRVRGHPYAFVAQAPAGALTLVALGYSHGKLPGLSREYRSDAYYRSEEYIARLPLLDTALLFTMVAGLLNLILIHDALRGVPGAVARRAEEQRERRRLDALREELERERQAQASEPEPEPRGDGTSTDRKGDEGEGEGEGEEDSQPAAEPEAEPGPPETPETTEAAEVAERSASAEAAEPVEPVERPATGEEPQA